MHTLFLSLSLYLPLSISPSLSLSISLSQDDLERLKIKEIVQGNEREARRDARAVENAKVQG